MSVPDCSTGKPFTRQFCHVLLFNILSTVNHFTLYHTVLLGKSFTVLFYWGTLYHTLGKSLPYCFTWEKPVSYCFIGRTLYHTVLLGEPFTILFCWENPLPYCSTGRIWSHTWGNQCGKRLLLVCMAYCTSFYFPLLCL